MRTALAVIAALVSIGLAQCEAPGIADAAPARTIFDIPDATLGDTITVPVDTSDQRVVYVRCDSPNGYLLALYKIVDRTVTIFFDPVYYPAGTSACVAIVGAYKGNGNFQTFAEDFFTLAG